MTRPELDNDLAPKTFWQYYWLKTELVSFCQKYKLPTSGSKQELSNMIADYLETGCLPIKRKKPKPCRSKMPKSFSYSTIIGPNWRCSQALRAFFEQKLGPGFHFDAIMRDLIHHGQGTSLKETIEIWQEAQKAPVVEKKIAPQFEYNRHMREYRKANPGASFQDAVRSWHEKKQKPKY